MTDSIREKLDHLPKSPGCYLFRNSSGQVIYIGKAKILRQRVRQYFQSPESMEPKTRVMVTKIAGLEIIQTDNEIEAMILESNLVKEYRPKYNIDLKDDKSFPYIKITDDLFPRIYVTREKDHRSGTFFGPYTDVKNLRATLKSLHHIFPIRSCTHIFTPEMIEQKKVKLCLDYHIQRCEGPCQGFIDAERYGRYISQMKQFLQGRARALIRQLNDEMNQLADSMRFEDAAKVRDRLQAVERYSRVQKVVLADDADRDLAVIEIDDDDACGLIFRIRDGKLIGKQHFYFSHLTGQDPKTALSFLLKTYYFDTDYIPDEILIPYAPADEEELKIWLEKQKQSRVELMIPKAGDKFKLLEMGKKNARFMLEELKLQRIKAKEMFIPKSLEALQRDLNLARLPRRIECFDNSNLQGSDPVASMVVLLDGRPASREYRKYKVKTVSGPDDFASMKEIVMRRYLRVLDEGTDMPGLIVIDGGKGQLSAAVEALQDIGIKVGTGERQIPAVIGLAKKREEIFFPGIEDPVMIPKTSPSLHLLQRIRDEAHRFAVTFHRQLRSKRTLHSALDTIDGVGPVRRSRLLKRFGSVKAIAESTPEAVRDAIRVSDELARKIIETAQAGTKDYRQKVRQKVWKISP